MKLTVRQIVKTDPGFSLLELMITVAIIAILASIAIPSYRDHLVKAEVSNAMSMLEGLKIKFIEHYTQIGRVTTTQNIDVGGNTKFSNIKYTLTTSQSDTGLTSYQLPQNSLISKNNIVGMVSATFYGSAQDYDVPTELKGRTLNLVAIDNGSSIVWLCVSGHSSNDYTQIPLKYLPKNCILWG